LQDRQAALQKSAAANLPESILKELRAYYRDKYLFEDRDGGKYSIRSAQHIFKAALQKAHINKDVGIHGLRHSFAIHLLGNSTDISYIQQLLGHNDIQTTLRYAQVAQKNLKKIKSPLDTL
jgi:site-specific recombinase XerD